MKARGWRRWLAELLAAAAWILGDWLHPADGDARWEQDSRRKGQRAA